MAKKANKKKENKKKSQEVDTEDLEKKVEEKIEQAAESLEKECDKKGGKFGDVIGGIISVAISIGMLIFINYYYDVIPVLTEDFEKWIPYANASLTVTIVGQILLIFFSKGFFKHFIQLVTNIVSLVSSIALLRIYPFDLTQKFIFVWPKFVVDLFLYVAIIGTGIAILVNFVKMFTSLAPNGCPEEDEDSSEKEE